MAEYIVALDDAAAAAAEEQSTAREVLKTT
jgi:hypothetical protein